MDSNIVVQLHYWPPVSWLTLAWQSSGLWIEACEHYQKGSYRNRCHIAGPNGIQRLSIPLAKGKHQQAPLRDVRIAYDEPWPQIHWRSIRTAYGNAPFFEHYADAVEDFYRRRYSFLFDLNLDISQFLLEKTGWTGALYLTNSFHADASQHTPPLRDFREDISPKGARPGWFEPTPYPQVFSERHGFLADLSGLDFLFCKGARK